MAFEIFKRPLHSSPRSCRWVSVCRNGNSAPTNLLLLKLKKAKLAAENASPIQLKKMEEALYRISVAQEGLDDQLDAHISFLNTILMASSNRFFIQLTQFVNAALRVSIRYTNNVKGVSNNDASFHQKVFEAIKNGDSVNAYKLVAEILEDALALIENRL